MRLVGKASSSKKVQRAAKAAASSRGASERRELGFPLAVLAVIILGIGLVVVARANREPAAPPRIGDHWHSAYSIYDCGEEVPFWQSAADPDGIHSHKDSVIHIHPFNKLASGRDATLGEFFSAFGGFIDDGSILLDTGELVVEGADCNGEPGVLKVARFDADDLDREPEVVTEDVAGIRFLKNREASVSISCSTATRPMPRK